MSALERFAAVASQRYGLALEDYWDLHSWSVEEPARFWALVWEFFDVRASQPYDQVLTDDPMPAQRWFTGARVNYVDQVLRHRDQPGAAIVSVAENGERREISWGQLADQVAAFAATLRRLGVRPGDRVAGYLTNSAEAIIAFLGCASVGGVWAGCAPDYGATAAAERIRQLEPTVLVAATGYDWAGKTYDRRPVLQQLVQLIGPRAVVTVEHAGLSFEPQDRPDTEFLTWEQAIAAPGDGRVEQVPADHPLWVLFSSGTTGIPKGIVHGHAGVLSAHLAMLGLQNDLGPDSTLFWYTTTNWMMWNIVTSALLVGATTVTYEGNPTAPDPDRLWKIVEAEKVTMFGTSPGHLQHGRTLGLHPGTDHDLGCLTQIAVTGAPVPAALNDWVDNAVKPGIPLVSVCGGTDVVSGFIGGAPNLPIRPGEISGPILGVAVTTYDAAGNPVTDQVGELVITAPYPSMPVYLWNDPDGRKYHRAYFDTFPGVWRQGDWATRTSHGSFVVHGRSDSTLNRNGVRIGSADLYQIVERHPAVAEALVLGVELPDGSYRMPMFLVAAPGHELDDATLEELKQRLRTEGSPRHVPDEMHVVEAIPHTKTGKKLEVPLKRILQGAAADHVLSTGAVDRPELLDYYTALATSWQEAS